MHLKGFSSWLAVIVFQILLDSLEEAKNFFYSDGQKIGSSLILTSVEGLTGSMYFDMKKSLPSLVAFGCQGYYTS